MGIFAFYFAVCLLALIVRGYYRVPSSCIIHEPIDKDQSPVKSIIADRLECRCHYTNFLWHKNWFDNDNQTMMNISMRNSSDKRQFEPTALVRK
jgi:hypothetical protein